MRTTLKQLRYLVAIADEGHFGRAAENCFVTQPTLSAGLQELEANLGVQLIERTKRTVLVTPLGLEVVERARRTLAEAESLEELIETRRSPLTGPLKLGVIPTIAPFLLPTLLPKLEKGFPDLQLYLREDQTHKLLEGLAKGEQDVLILALPWDIGDCRSYVFADDGFLVACPPGHHFAKETSIKASALLDEELLLLEDGHCLRDHALAACHLNPATTSPSFQGTSLPTLILMAANGLGITLLPEMAVNANLLQSLNIVTRPLAETTGTRQIGLVWRRTSGRGEELTQLGQFLKEN
ncbi:MAG: LysR substrate-binding domain-containing protein [Rhodospirillales bacterium]|nr:LysR substrate-binding domain-containing protein [Rhodospirillales bacterium]